MIELCQIVILFGGCSFQKMLHARSKLKEDYMSEKASGDAINMQTKDTN